MKGLQFIILLIGSLILGIALSSFTLPINGQMVPFKTFVPNIVVPGEPLGPDWLWNSLFTTFIVDAVIIIMAILGRRGLGKDGGAPTNWWGRAWEAFVEYLYKNYMVPTLGSRAKAVAPLALSFFVFILVSAMFELVPGNESIGITKAAPEGFRGFCAVKAGPAWLITGYEVDRALGYEASCGYPLPQAENAIGPEKMAALATDASAAPASAPVTAEKGDPNDGAAIIPFLRRPTSVLSTTLALALVAFVFVEIQGIRANGIHYFERFFQVGAWRRGKQGMMTGFISYIQAGLVGPLELISEFLRIISLSFRLFGNMFAGTVLVLVMMSILPALLPAIFFGLEFAVGVIQSFVFFLLITIFTSLAVAHSEH